MNKEEKENDWADTWAMYLFLAQLLCIFMNKWGGDRGFFPCGKKKKNQSINLSW
jgi:hypothetical protein